MRILHILKDNSDINMLIIVFPYFYLIRQVVELKSQIAHLQTENNQLERVVADSKRMKDKLGQVERKAADYHRHSNLMQQEAQNISQELRAVTEKER